MSTASKPKFVYDPDASEMEIETKVEFAVERGDLSEVKEETTITLPGLTLPEDAPLEGEVGSTGPIGVEGADGNEGCDGVNFDEPGELERVAKQWIADGVSVDNVIGPLKTKMMELLAEAASGANAEVTKKEDAPPAEPARLSDDEIRAREAVIQKNLNSKTLRELRSRDTAKKKTCAQCMTRVPRALIENREVCDTCRLA